MKLLMGLEAEYVLAEGGGRWALAVEARGNVQRLRASVLRQVNQACRPRACLLRAEPRVGLQ